MKKHRMTFSLDEDTRDLIKNLSQETQIDMSHLVSLSVKEYSQDKDKRIKNALILMNVAGISASESINQLTLAIEAFRSDKLNTTEIANKLAGVDTRFAVSAKDLSDSIKRSGSAAQECQVGFEKLLALTTSLQETTARGGAIIGNALKEIFINLRKLSVCELLESLNIKTKDKNGNCLSADIILQNLSKKYSSLNKEKQDEISEKIAGLQQVTQLKALLKDLNSSNSVYLQSLNKV